MGSEPTPRIWAVDADDAAADAKTDAAADTADGAAPEPNPCINPATPQCSTTDSTPIILVTEYLKLPLMISETNPLSRVMSGDSAPKNAASILKEVPMPPALPLMFTPARMVLLKSGNKKNTSVTKSRINDSTLNVSEAAAILVESAIVLHQ